MDIPQQLRSSRKICWAMLSNSFHLRGWMLSQRLQLQYVCPFLLTFPAFKPQIMTPCSHATQKNMTFDVYLKLSPIVYVVVPVNGILYHKGKWYKPPIMISNDNRLWNSYHNSSILHEIKVCFHCWEPPYHEHFKFELDIWIFASDVPTCSDWSLIGHGTLPNPNYLHSCFQIGYLKQAWKPESIYL